MSVATLENLSDLQKSLLRIGLRAHYRAPLGPLADEDQDPGSFTVQTVGRPADPDAFSLRRKKASKEERRKNASLRSAAGLSIERLIKRGLVESCSRGRWRLTKRGFKVARELWPELKPMSQRELASTIALREAIHTLKPGLRKRWRSKPLALAPRKSVEASERFAPKPEGELEIEMDY